MTADLDLFTQPAARHNDPETAKAAARSVKHSAPVQRTKIVTALKAHGPMNHWQIDNVLGFQHPTAARRMQELIRLGVVRDAGYTTQTGSGRQATTYEAMP